MGISELTQTELHEKLGLPQAVRDRKAALRVFTYYPIGDWDQYFKKVVSPENGEDVYTFKRDGVDVRYSFSYTFDPNDQSEQRSPLVTFIYVDVEFSPAVPLARVPDFVPEFKPSEDISCTGLPIQYHVVVLCRNSLGRCSVHYKGKGERGTRLVASRFRCSRCRAYPIR